ncbi:MAG: DinB family protein [Planctomycetota bacterium]|jgi:hypothetical protein|nr:DinB family protein [Planctomycetota bacterium]
MDDTKSHQPTTADILLRHLEPTLEMLRNAIEECPEEAWHVETENAPFWQQAYHILIGLDFFLRDDAVPFKPPPFHTDEAAGLDPGAKPVIPRDEISGFMNQVFQQTQEYLSSQTEQSVTGEVQWGEHKWSPADRVLAQLRHVSHHLGSMQSMLRRHTGIAPGWLGFSE